MHDESSQALFIGMQIVNNLNILAKKEWLIVYPHEGIA